MSVNQSKAGFWTKIFIVATASALFLGFIVGKVANAHEEQVNARAMDKYEARAAARQYLNTLGYGRPGTSVFSASVGSAELENGKWIVKVRTGGWRPMKSGIIVLDAADGNILNQNGDLD